MSANIKLPDDLVTEAKRHATLSCRSVPKQIEYWSRIGKIAEENPDLSYVFLKDILMAQAEVRASQVEPYKPPGPQLS